MNSFETERAGTLVCGRLQKTVDYPDPVNNFRGIHFLAKPLPSRLLRT
jgi:hypothetical protein